MESPAPTDGRFIRLALIAAATLVLCALVVTPLFFVFVSALHRGIPVYIAAISDPDSVAAIKLTLMVIVMAVPCNLVFGLSAAWLITRFEFRGKRLLLAAIDIPFAVSPVIAGMMLVLLFGSQGWFGPLLLGSGVQIIFATPGIVLATVFVTLPLIVRELIPLMQLQGREEEEAAAMLGAGGWQIFLRVTLPNIKWALAHGVFLCTARGMGEFGAVSVVSGHIRGVTNTIPLHVEILYNEYNNTAAFASASLLTVVALLSLAVKMAAARSELASAHDADSTRMGESEWK